MPSAPGPARGGRCARPSAAWVTSRSAPRNTNHSASAGAGSGLAYRIAESGYRLNIPRMFAALLLLSTAGIVIYLLLALVSHLLLRRWHESALGKDN